MAAFGLKICEHAFQTIPDISFFHVKQIKIFANFDGSFTPRGWLRSASNFGKTRFKWSATFQFSTPKTFFATNFVGTKQKIVNTPKIVSAKCLFWRSCACLDVAGRCASKIHCQTYRFQPSMTLGEGVKETISVFFREFWQKKLKPLRWKER